MANDKKLTLCPEPNPSRYGRMAEAIARAHGISWDAAEFLMFLATVGGSVGTDVRDYDVDGLSWLMWLSHRGLVDLEDSMGILYARISQKGCRVVIDARKGLGVTK